MKKYVKPDVYYENFELNRNVASCSVDGDKYLAKQYTNAADEYSCTFTIGGGIMTFFHDGVSGCTNDPESDLSYEEYCYQTGSQTYNFFAS